MEWRVCLGYEPRSERGKRGSHLSFVGDELTPSGGTDAHEEIDRRIVTPSMMAHPFHVHGVAFQVLFECGGPPRPQNRGMMGQVTVGGDSPGDWSGRSHFAESASRQME